MQEGVYDGGAWNESQRYAGAILRTWVPLFYDIKRLMGYDLFQNENFKAMLNFFVETQTPSNPAREAESGQTGYFVGRAPAIGDEIGENSEADLIYNGLCADAVEISGNEAVFYHPSGAVNLKIVVLNHGGVTFSSSAIPLADGTPWGSQLQSLKITSKYPEADGFVTILYPYRDGDPDLTAVYNNETEQIQVICGERTDLIDWSNGEITVFPQKQPIPLRKSFMRSL